MAQNQAKLHHSSRSSKLSHRSKLPRSSKLFHSSNHKHSHISQVIAAQATYPLSQVIAATTPPADCPMCQGCLKLPHSSKLQQNIAKATDHSRIGSMIPHYFETPATSTTLNSSRRCTTSTNPVAKQEHLSAFLA
ncbi:hypothetical protein U1Q18_033319 [Sarracenia purpurea var. burkii]